MAFYVRANIDALALLATLTLLVIAEDITKEKNKAGRKPDELLWNSSKLSFSLSSLSLLPILACLDAVALWLKNKKTQFKTFCDCGYLSLKDFHT